MMQFSRNSSQFKSTNCKRASTITKMLSAYFLLIAIFHTPSNVEGLELLDQLLSPIISFKEDLISGIFGKGKCGCPCREYWVPKCEVNYVQQCHYDHYQNQVCETMPVTQIRQAKETECQKCRRYTVPTPVTKHAIECNPVYDEKCHTTYPQHCKVEQRCHHLYQTVCESNGYDPHGGYGGHGQLSGQNCASQPREHCYPETKCHRTPMTKCKPVQKEKCIKVPREVIVQKEEKQCLPFEISQAQIDAIAHADPCLQQGITDLGGQVLAQGVGNSYGGPVISHDVNAGHHHVAPANNAYSVGTHQQEQAVNGYTVQQPRQFSGGHHHDQGFIQRPGSNAVPVDNLYTVDAVPGGVLVKREPLPSNQYYGGRIGERKQPPQGYNNVNVAVVEEQILGLNQDSQHQYNQKRQINPFLQINPSSKNPFLRRLPRRSKNGRKQPRRLNAETKSRPARFEKVNARIEQDTNDDVHTSKISERRPRFTPDSYKGWKPILYPVEGRRR